MDGIKLAMRPAFFIKLRNNNVSGKSSKENNDRYITQSWTKQSKMAWFHWAKKFGQKMFLIWPLWKKHCQKMLFKAMKNTVPKTGAPLDPAYRWCGGCTMKGTGRCLRAVKFFSHIFLPMTNITAEKTWMVYHYLNFWRQCNYRILLGVLLIKVSQTALLSQW